MARAVEASGQASGTGPVLPASVLTNRNELEAHLQIAAASTGSPSAHQQVQPLLGPSTALASDMVLPASAEDVSVSVGAAMKKTVAAASEQSAVELMPEMETLDVTLIKDSQGLGITIAGYTCEREELSGIFVKSVNEGSSAYRSGKVAVNDQIVEVDGHSIQGYTNQQAVEMLRSTGKSVRLKLVRYVHGLKFEQLQQAIAHSQSNSQVTTPSVASPQQQQAMIRTDSVVSETNVDATRDVDRESQSKEQGPSEEDEANDTDFQSPLTPEKEAKLKEKWSRIMGPNYQIIPAQLTKFKASGGLGISLEGTVEKVDGEEQNPHHYIRSVLPNGPVGQNGRLRSGDELLEVNGIKLLGLYHTDVVTILKDLPMTVRIVCARAHSQSASVGTNNHHHAPYNAAASDRLVKAKSDGSISSAGTVTDASQQPNQQAQGSGGQQQQQSKLKSRSLEPLTSLAMWSEEVLTIELVKGERGLGFSILDYQVRSTAFTGRSYSSAMSYYKLSS